MTDEVVTWTHPLGWGPEPVPMLLDGQWYRGDAGESFDTFDPGTGEVIATVVAGGATAVDEAVASARASFEDERWRGLSGTERGVILWRVADLMRTHADDLAELESLNLGLPVAKSRGLVIEASNQFRYFAGLADKIHGRTIDLGPADKRIQGYTLREPVGVAGLITPWNAPLSMAAKKLAPALAAGCSCVIKPAEETPLTTLWLGHLLLRAGVPAGVVNVVTGLGESAGAALVAHMDVDAVSFTGSTEVGRLIASAATGNMKKVALELGGKSPVIVLPDADMATTIPEVAMSVFGNSGQVCAAGTRLFVHAGVYQQVVEGVAGVGRKLRLGPVTDRSADLGPLISHKQLDRVTGYVDAGRKDGAQVVTGGSRAGDRGYFFQPTVLVDVDQSMSVMREEIFGPVLGVMPFADVDEAVKMANDTSYGLASSIFTKDGALAHSLARRLRAGRVGINVHRAGGSIMPAGGYRQSGWGRESGPEALDAYLETKSVVSTLT
jgi:phenylacetaldehyde dehydrogenase